MISRIQGSISPSFGFAKLNETGRDAAEKFGLTQNTFLNDDMYKRQRFYNQSALSKALSEGGSFPDLCRQYGCTEVGRANASFIETQLLSHKSDSALKSLTKEQAQEGLMALYHSNYDNPELSKLSTRGLLKMIKNYIAPEQYIQNIGLIDEGADK